MVSMLFKFFRFTDLIETDRKVPARATLIVLSNDILIVVIAKFISKKGNAKGVLKALCRIQICLQSIVLNDLKY